MLHKQLMIDLIAIASGKGQKCMVKVFLQAMFRNALAKKQDWELLGINWKGELYGYGEYFAGD